METEIMQEAYKFLNTNGVFTGSQDDFRAKLWEMWFEQYDRDETLPKLELKIKSDIEIKQPS
jgi:hypothetical protein